MTKPADDTFEVIHVEFILGIKGEWEETGRKWVSTYRRKDIRIELASIRSDGAEPVDLAAMMPEFALAKGL